MDAAASLAAARVLHQREALERRLQRLPFIRLWWEFGELRAGDVAWGDGRGGDGEGAQAVLAGAERAAPPRDPRGRRAGGGVGRARGAAEFPVVSAHRRWLGVIDEDLRGPLGHRGRRVWKRVSGWGRRGAGQGPVYGGAVVDRWSRLVPRQRGRQSGRDGGRTVGPGAQL